jgi:drug/metabolite transporter (DMT)-like permease
MILIGDFIDLAWHARHGEFKKASDVLHGHWLSWLGLVIVIAVCVVALTSDHPRSRPGFRAALIASAVYAVGSVWNFWGHVHGTETFFAHVLLFGSKVGIVAAGAFTTHLVIGHDENPGLFRTSARPR